MNRETGPPGVLLAVVVVAALPLILMACAPRGPGGGTAAAGDEVPGEVRRTGTLAVVGSVPTERLVLRVEEGPPLTLEGRWVAELRGLSGMRVAVEGRSAVDERFEVERYEVVGVDGRPVISGTVEAGEGGRLHLRTPAGRVYHLQEPPSRLRPGQEIWVEVPPALRVQTYGVIREP
jgi:hypothetical protein